MNTRRTGFGAAMLLALAIPGATVTAAFGQMTGVSHPDELPAATAPDSATLPLIYIPTPSPSPALQSRPTASPAALTTYDPNEYKPYAPLRTAKSFNPDEAIVGDAMPRPDGTIDVDAGIVTRITGPSNRLPEGTLLHTRMLQSLSTQATDEGAEWRAELTAPVMRDGRVLLPAGAVLRGRVTEVHGGRRISGRALIHLETVSLGFPDGTSLGLHAQVVDTSLNNSTKVNEEGTILHRDHHVEQAAVLGLTAGSGAVAGAMVAGVPGALVGAGVGAGLSTVIWLKQDRQAELPKNTQVTFELTHSLSIGQE